MQICKRSITEFENCTFRNVEGPVQPLRQAVLGLSHFTWEGTVFNYCKIQVSNGPKSTLRKSYRVFRVS